MTLQLLLAIILSPIQIHRTDARDGIRENDMAALTASSHLSNHPFFLWPIINGLTLYQDWRPGTYPQSTPAS